MARTTSSDQLPIVVVGAGVIGLAIAFRLIRESPNVTLIDRGQPGMECSFGNAGHIATEQIFPLASPATLARAPRLLWRRDRPLSIRRGYVSNIFPWLMRFAWAARPSSFRKGTAALASLQSAAMESLRDLCADAGIESMLHRRGHLILVEDERSTAAARTQMQLMSEHGIAVEWMSPDRIAALAPELKRNIAGGIYVAETGHVGDPLRLCQGLFESFVAAGGQFVQEEVRRIGGGEHGFELALTSRSLPAAKVIVAAGAWARRFAEQTGFDVPLDTERGYHVTAEGWRGSFDVAIASFERLTIMTPLDAGLRITGFVEFGGLDLPPHPDRIATLHRHLAELLPGAEMTELSEWMGFRPSLADHLPVIGRSPHDANLIYAFGHQHLGLTLAGVTADIVASMIGGRDDVVDLQPFRIDRF